MKLSITITKKVTKNISNINPITIGYKAIRLLLYYNYMNNLKNNKIKFLMSQIILNTLEISKVLDRTNNNRKMLQI